MPLSQASDADARPVLEPPAFCLPKDQRNLSPAAYERALELREQIAALVEGRGAFLERSGRDPSIHEPRANWRLGAGLYAAYRTVRSGAYEVLNHLRLFSQIFTGYRLLTLENSEKTPIPTALPADLDERLAARAACPDAWVKAYVETVRYLPESLWISPPHALGEVGWRWRGRILNHDTFVYLERIALLALGGKLWELRQRGGPPPRILEIGPGYGGLAYHLKKLIPDARYFCVDIPESLLFSSLYLSTLFEAEDNVVVTPDSLHLLDVASPGFTFLPNYLFDDCAAAAEPFDLIINTLSMSEMAASQVRYYCDGIARLLAPEGVFFEQNHDQRRTGLLDARRIIREEMAYCLPLRSPSLGETQGLAHLWSPRPFGRHSWIDSRDYLHPRPFWRGLRRLGGRLLRALKLRG